MQCYGVGVGGLHHFAPIAPEVGVDVRRNVEPPAVDAVGGVAVAIGVHPALRHCEEMLSHGLGQPQRVVMLESRQRAVVLVPCLVVKGLEAGDVPEGDKGKLVKETADDRESEESFVSAELYPNPVRDNAKLSLTLSSEEALSSWSFQLIDGRGAIVMSKSIGNSDQIIEMDRNLNPGFYFYRIKRNDGLKSSEWKKLEIIR